MLSLVLVGAAAGGVSSLPRSLHAIRHSLRVMVARTLVARARADLRLHFTKATLHSASSASSASSLAAAAAAALETAGSGGASSSGGNSGPAGAAGAAAESKWQGPKGSLAAAAAAGAAARRQKEALVEEYVAHAKSMPPQPKHVSLHLDRAGDAAV